MICCEPWLLIDVRIGANSLTKESHNTSCPFFFRIVRGIFNVPHWTYPLESLTISWRNYKGSTFSWVILSPWVWFRLESSSRPPAWQPDAQPTEPLVRGWFSLESSGGVVMRALASHQFGRGSFSRVVVIRRLSLLIVFSAMRGFPRVLRLSSLLKNVYLIKFYLH